MLAHSTTNNPLTHSCATSSHVTDSHISPDLAYRRDIDGLRAIAVGSVIAFHAFPHWVSGGFVGVDIFFVISGYLISSIILKTSAQETFSVVDFYARRIRRIFPALITLLITSMLIGWLLLFPDELQQLGTHVLSASFFVLNFNLWSEAGYFDHASELKPLLHLWSLSIEEQFYTLWPITLLFFIRRGKPGLWVAALTLSSLLLCVSGLLGKTANFYMPLSRVWELLCGGLLAYHQTRNSAPLHVFHNKPILQRALGETSAFIGILLLGLAIFYLDSKTAFPGWASLLPTVGATILIAAGPATRINRYLLGNPLFVFIGLISYPLYLWHWPLLSFPKITNGLNLSVHTRLIAIVSAVALATLTYYLIEKPLRHKGNTTSKLLLLAALITALIGALFFNGQLHPKNFDILMQKIAATDEDVPLKLPLSATSYVYIDNIEYFTAGKGKKTTLYIGDSHMQQYWQGIDILIGANDGSRKAILGGCRLPILNTQKTIKEKNDCSSIAKNAHTFAMAANDPDIDTIVMAAQWLGFDTYDYVEGDKAYSLRTATGKKKALDQLESTILGLTKQGKTVYLLLNIPCGAQFNPHNLVKRSLLGFQEAVRLEGGISLEEHKKMMQSISPALRDVAQRSGAIILDPADSLCVNGWCNAVSADGEPIYRGDDHLRGTYSLHYPDFIGQTLKPAPGK